MIDILNLALPYFGLIFIGYACGKAKGLPESGLVWMNFFLLYVSLPALLFGIMILIVPRLLNYLIAIYLILIGLVGLFPHLFAVTTTTTT